MQANRSFYSLKSIKLKGMTTLRYSYFKAPFPEEQKIMCNKFNPLQAKYRDVFDEVPQDILRWRVITRTSAADLPKAVSRTHLARRWKAAFLEVMRKKGYAPNGKRIANGEEVRGLQGTLEVPIHGGKGMNESYSELLRQAEMAVDALENERSVACAGPLFGQGAWRPSAALIRG